MSQYLVLRNLSYNLLDKNSIKLANRIPRDISNIFNRLMIILWFLVSQKDLASNYSHTSYKSNSNANDKNNDIIHYLIDFQEKEY